MGLWEPILRQIRVRAWHENLRRARDRREFTNLGAVLELSIVTVWKVAGGRTKALAYVHINRAIRLWDA